MGGVEPNPLQRRVALLRRADDGLDGPALPVLPAPDLASRTALHRDGDRAGARARRRAAPPRLRSRRAPGGTAARRQRSAPARARGEARRALGLRRDQSQLRLSLRARADRQLRRVPDGGARAGRRLREGDARRGVDSGHRQAPHRPRRGRGLRFRARLRRHGRRGGLRGVRRARAQRRAEGAVAEGEPRGAAAALRGRAPARRATSRSS